MKFSNFQIQGKLLTEREIQHNFAKVKKAYSLAITNINNQIFAFYDKFMTETPKGWELARVDRLNKLKDDIAKSYTEINPAVSETVRTSSQTSFLNNYYRQQYSGHLYSDMTYLFTPASQQAMRVAVNWEANVYASLSDSKKREYAAIRPKYADKRRKKYKNFTLKQVLQANDKQTLKDIGEALQSQIALGASPQKTSSAVKKTLNKVERVGDKTIKHGSLWRVQRIVRTESARLMEAGKLLNNRAMQDQGFDLVRIWDATLDNRTRSQSVEMDGQQENKDGFFEYPNGALGRYPGDSGVAAYDINERCTAVDTLGGENPDKRIARNPETGETEQISYKKFNQWANENGLERSVYGEPYKLK